LGSFTPSEANLNYVKRLFFLSQENFFKENNQISQYDETHYSKDSISGSAEIIFADDPVADQ
jgi:hypothetical protein